MLATATRIAHVSDVHMLDARPSRTRSGYSMGHRFVSLGRPLDAERRAKNLARALESARRAAADWVVVSGDLTEMGEPGEFEAFARVLHDSKLSPDRVTLVPGNHDSYSSPSAWANALEGPLAAFARTSARAPGHVVDLANVSFFPLDVACHQAITRSAGEVTDGAALELERRLTDSAFRDKALVLVQHHPPFARATPVWDWVDGLRGGARIMSMLARLPNLHVLHGHLHHAVDRIVAFGKARILGAPAIVDAPRVRLYEVRGGLLESAGLVTSPA